MRTNPRSMPPLRVYVGYIASEVTAFGSPVVYLPMIVLLWRLGLADWQLPVVILVLTEAACGVWKLAWPVPRPVPRPPKTFLDRYDAGSFPSIHSARAAACATWLVRTLHDPLLSILAVALVLGVGWSRVHLRQHYWRDVVGGFCAGSGIALAVLALW